jgi:hypothetical protein
LENTESNRICSGVHKTFNSRHLSSKDFVNTNDILKERDFIPDGLTDIEEPKTVLKSNTFTKQNFIQVLLDFDKPCTPAESDKNWTFEQIDPSV